MEIPSNYQKHTSKNLVQKFLINHYFSAVQRLMPDDIKTVLDVGCGEGFLLQHLPLITEYIGIDFNEDSIKIAENSKHEARNSKQIQKIKFQKQDIYNLNFTDNSFDCVFCLEVLEHLDNFERAISEIKRVAKKWVILSVPNEPWFQLSNFLRGKYLARLGNHPEHTNKWNAVQFPTLVSKYFTIIKKAYPFPWQIHLCEIK